MFDMFVRCVGHHDLMYREPVVGMQDKNKIQKHDWTRASVVQLEQTEMSESNGTDREELQKMEFPNNRGVRKTGFSLVEKLSILVGPATCKDIGCFI